MPLLNLSIAREIAYDAFVKIMNDKRQPEAVLDELYEENKKSLKRLDRNFIKEIVYGGLRWYSKIFWILQNTSKRKLTESTPQIQAALVLGTYQIYYMDRVPDRAAVNESVEYVRRKGQSNACSFVNGILRQISRRAEYFAKPDKQTKQAEYLALQFAHPRWMVDRWLTRFNFERLSAMLAANNQPPPISIRLNVLKVDPLKSNELQQELLKQERTHSDRRPLRTCLRLKEFPNLETGSLFHQGLYTIQDEASQLIAFLVDPREGESIVDACCGPGGKLTHMFELGGGKVHITGTEADEYQFARTRENLQRLDYTAIELIHADFRQWKPATPVDKVLLDAPCSGLGVLRRHPEGKWHKQSTIISDMVSKQKELVPYALSCIKPGGELIYSVCSFEPEETIGIRDWIVDRFGDKVEVVSPVARLPDYYKKYVTRDNFLLIYGGNQDEMDGFGAFVIRVKEPIARPPSGG